MSLEENDFSDLQCNLRELNASPHIPPTSGLQAYLRKIATCLHSEIHIAKLAYREIREFLRKALASSELAVILDAAQLYLDLLSIISVAYEELSLSACIHHIGRIIKDIKAKCGQRCSRKTKICSQNGHVAVAKYASFWRTLNHLIESKVLDACNPNIISLALNGYETILQYARVETLLSIAFSGVQAVLDAAGGTALAVTTVCKMCYPIVRLALPGANRRMVANVLVATVESENHTSSTAEQREMSEQGEDPDVRMEPVESPTPRRNSGQPNSSRVLKFLEFCCVKSSEKADEREALAGLVQQVLLRYDGEGASKFHKFLERTACHPKMNVRMLAVEIAAMLVGKQLGRRQDQSITSLVIRLLGSRSQDSMPTVRAKAISSLTSVAKSLSPEDMESSMEELDRICTQIAPRLRDEKTKVRKSAVEFLGFVCQQYVFWGRRRACTNNAATCIGSEVSNGDAPDAKVMRVVSNLKLRCSDASSMVRLVAIEQLSKILSLLPTKFFGIDIDAVFRLWIEGVLPQVDDADPRCNEACLSCMESILFPDSNAMAVEEGATFKSPSALDHNDKYLLMSFLSHIGGGDQNVRGLGTKALSALCEQNKMGRKEISVLSDIVKKSNGNFADTQISGAWVALEAAALGGKAGDVKAKLGQDFIIKEIESKGGVSAFYIAAKLATKMDATTKTELEASVRKFLLSGSRMSGRKDGGLLYAPAIELLASLRKDLGDELLEECETVLGENGVDAQDETATNVLHIIGAVCLCFKLKKVPSDMLVTFVKAMTSDKQSSSKLRALALATLGKICLCEGMGNAIDNNRSSNENQNFASNQLGESLTRRLVSVFVHELDNATSSATRNNAVIVLCDLCRQYTSVVEPHVARLAGLLSDPSEFVRVQVISALVSLLQEDYMKIRTGALFYQITVCLLDSSSTVRATAEYALLQVVSQKNASILAVSFVELVFVLNGCRECRLYNQFAGSQNLGIQKLDSFAQRANIYDVFLRGMTPEHLIRLPGRFRSDIIALITEEKLSMAFTSVQSVLEDTLQLLCSERLNPYSKNKKSGEQDGLSQEVPEMSEVTANEGDNRAAQSKKASLIKKLQLLELRETTVPALLELRHHLEAKRSPLLRVMMRTLCKLLRPHRADLEMMIVDPVVRSEIAHQISQMQENGAQRNRAMLRLSQGENIGSTDENAFRVGNQSVPRHATPRASARKPPLGDRGSIARTRRLQKRRISVVDERSEDEGDEDDDIDDESLLRSAVRSSARQKVADQIGASPKLASISRRSSLGGIGDDSAEMGQGGSGFAMAMARIEEETRS